MKRKTVVVLTLLAVVVGGAITWQAMKPTPPTKVVLAKAERVADLRAIVSATGEIRAKEFVDIQAEVTGVITEVLVKEGDTVAKGTVLLRLEDLQLRAEADGAAAQLGAAEADAKNAEVGVATAEANLAAERTALANVRVESEQAKISCERAEASFRRKEELFQGNLIGSEEYEIASAEARLARQRLQYTEARIAQAEANLHAVATRVDAAKSARDSACKRVEAQRAGLARAKDMFDKTVLKAPLSGLITKLNVEKGERAVPGFQSNPVATLMTIADMSVIEAEIRVAEADIVDVAIGAPAEVEVDAIRDAKWKGTVTEIGQSPIQSASSGNSQNQEGKEFKVVVRLESPPPQMRPGFTATAEIVTATRSDVLVVPFQAQTAREVEVDAAGNHVPGPEPKDGDKERVLTAAERQKRKELPGVFVLREGRARFQPIKAGVIGDSMDVEVLEGLREGDEVISGPNAVLRTLKDWDRVQLDDSRIGAGAAAANRDR
jgi:HlyD family secretion protein